MSSLTPSSRPCGAVLTSSLPRSASYAAALLSAWTCWSQSQLVLCSIPCRCQTRDDHGTVERQEMTPLFILHRFCLVSLSTASLS